MFSSVSTFSSIVRPFTVIIHRLDLTFLLVSWASASLSSIVRRSNFVRPREQPPRPTIHLTEGGQATQDPLGSATLFLPISSRENSLDTSTEWPTLFSPPSAVYAIPTNPNTSAPAAAQIPAPSHVTKNTKHGPTAVGSATPRPSCPPRN